MAIGNSLRRFTAVLIDLDDCLYRVPEIALTVKRFIQDYMVDVLHVPPAEVEDACKAMYVDYGTTMAGLLTHGYKIDFDDWHAKVHGGLDYDRLLQPDAELRDILFSLKLPRFVFTNADKGVVHFESVQTAAASTSYDAPSRDASPVVCKPQRAAFEYAMHQCGLKDPSTVIFMDDSVRNIRAAHAMGMFTVLVGATEPVEGADIVLPTMHEIKHVLPDLLHTPSMPLAEELSPQAVERFAVPQPA